jgi:glycosyltransferase involved in cell wall biosynthesis
MIYLTISDSWPGCHAYFSGAEYVAEAAHPAGHPIVTLKKDRESDIKLDQVAAPLRGIKEIVANLPVDLVCWLSLLGKILKHRPDHIYLHGHYLYIPAIAIAKMLRIPVTYFVSDYFPFCPRTYLSCGRGRSWECGSCKCKHKLVPGLANLLTYISMLVFRWANKYPTMNALTKTSADRMPYYGIARNRIVIKYPFQIPEINRATEGAWQKKVFYGGSMSPENGFEILKAAMLGIDWKRSGLVVATGLARKEALEKMDGCDLVCLPFQFNKDFGPMILLEALALGKKVLVSDLGSAREFAPPDALVKDYSNPQEWRRRILECLN